MSQDPERIDRALAKVSEYITHFTLNLLASQSPVLGSAGLVLAPIVLEQLEKRRERVERLGSYTLELVDGAALLELIQTDDEFGELFTSCLEAAQRKTDEQHLRALGRALANIVNGDDAAIDESRFVAQVIRELEPAHVAGFAHLLRLHQQRPEGQVGVFPPEASGLPMYVRGSLLRLGMTTELSVWNGTALAPTDFGQRILAFIESA